MVQKSKIYRLKYLIFLNNLRGLNITKVFLEKGIDFDVVITSKNLNREIIKDLKKNKIHFFSIKNLNSFEKKINKNYDVFIIAGFPHILKQSIIDIPKFGCINLHAGPLPKYRGGSPLNWQIIKNEKKLGISIIKLNVKIDDGKILIKKFFLLKKNENILNAHKKANILFNKYIFESLYKLINKRYLKKIGNNNYFRQRDKLDSKVHLNKMTANDVFNLTRAQYPLYPPAFIIDKSKKILFKRVYIEKKNLTNLTKYRFFFKCKKNYIGIKIKDILNLT